MIIPGHVGRQDIGPVEPGDIPMMPTSILLVEGGNVWPDTVTNFNPEEIGKPLTSVTQKYLEPLAVEVHTVGSCWKPRLDKLGKPVPASDLDAMLDLGQLMTTLGTTDAKTTRKALSEYLKQQGLDTVQTGVTVHVKMPLGNNFYQVDLKVVSNAAKVAQFHRHDIPAGSPYKGVNKQLIMNALATSQGMLWSPDEGLYARNSAGKKSSLLTDDWDEIAKYLLGPTAKGTDLGSVESIMTKIPDTARQEQIMNMARSGHSWQAATPTVGTNEWFTKMKRLLV